MKKEEAKMQLEMQKKNNEMMLMFMENMNQNK